MTKINEGNEENQSWLKSPHSEYEIHSKKIWLKDKKGEAKNPEHAKLYREYNDLWDITETSDKEKIQQLDKLQDKINLMLDEEHANDRRVNK